MFVGVDIRGHRGRVSAVAEEWETKNKRELKELLRIRFQRMRGDWESLGFLRCLRMKSRVRLTVSKQMMVVRL